MKSPNTVNIFVGVDDSLKEMVRRFFPILASYSIIERFYESRSGFDYGMVNDALAAAIGNLVHDYRIFICQLESLLLKTELSLQKTWYLLQPNVTTLHQLHHVTLSMMRAKAQGGQVLSVLHQQTMEAMGNDKQQKLLLSLTRSAAQPYWDILQKWIYQGSVEDPYLEFMVEDHQVSNHSGHANVVNNYSYKHNIYDDILSGGINGQALANGLQR